MPKAKKIKSGSKHFIRQAMHIPNLPKEEESKLLRLAKDGNLNARNRIVEAYLKVSIKIVLMHFNNPHREDLMQVGNIAIIDAIRDFDFNKGVPFNRFISGYIWLRLLNYIHYHVDIVKIPDSVREARRMFSEALQELHSQLDREPTTDELYRAMKDKMRWNLTRQYFDEIANDTETIYFDIQEDDLIGDPVDDLNANIDIHRLLPVLSEEERGVVTMFYGLNGRKYRAKELAEKLSTSPDDIFIRVRKAVEKMRDYAFQKDNNLS